MPPQFDPKFRPKHRWPGVWHGLVFWQAHRVIDSETALQANYLLNLLSEALPGLPSPRCSQPKGHASTVAFMWYRGTREIRLFVQGLQPVRMTMESPPNSMITGCSFDLAEPDRVAKLIAIIEDFA